MKIQNKHRFHGSALAQICEHELFTALNKASGKIGHYHVNKDIRILIKYDSKENSPWNFTFTDDDVDKIKHDADNDYSVFICLVCGNKTIMCIEFEDVDELIDLDWGDQWIKVEYPTKGSMRVSGSEGKLGRTIPHNSFPEILFK